jgi:hypothetical protein
MDTADETHYRPIAACRHLITAWRRFTSSAQTLRLAPSARCCRATWAAPEKGSINASKSCFGPSNTVRYAVEKHRAQVASARRGVMTNQNHEEYSWRCPAGTDISCSSRACTSASFFMAAFSSLLPPSMNPATTAATIGRTGIGMKLLIASGCAHATNCDGGKANLEMHTHEGLEGGTVETRQLCRAYHNSQHSDRSPVSLSTQ